MRAVALVVAVVLAVSAPAVGAPSGPDADSGGIPPGTRVETYLGNLDFPVDMAWVPGSSKIFFTEKNTGRVRIVTARGLRAEPCADLDVNNENERGALGIALDPFWGQNKRIYVYYTYDADPAAAPPPENRVTRFDVVDNRCVNPFHVVTIPSPNSRHNGGQIQFVAGKLFVATGDGTAPSRAQNLDSLLGKVLRYNPDGTIPSDNPFLTSTGAPSPVWSYGHRNPFGLAHKPGAGWLFESENGENCDDELNRVRRGRNYGWGIGYACDDPVGPSPLPPLAEWGDPDSGDPVIVPTDLWWYEGAMPELSGSLYMGDFTFGRIHRFDFDSTGSSVVASGVVHDDPGHVVDVSAGPGGWLYFMTTSAIKRIVPES